MTVEHGWVRCCAVALALMPLPLLTGCWEPHVISEEYGRRCEALGYRFGSDAYADCAGKLKEQAVSGGEMPAPAPKGAASLRQICDKNGTSAALPGRYLVKDDILKDTKTGLTWQRCSVGQGWRDDAGCVGTPLQLTWDEAKIGANNGWRLPTEEELMTLVSASCRFPAIDMRAFPGMNGKAMWYWSETPNGPMDVWGVDFRDGKASSVDSDAAIGAIRLVRSD